MLLWLLLALGGAAYLFRRQIRQRLAAAIPDQATRHRVAGTIITAFVMVFALRLLARWWS